MLAKAYDAAGNVSETCNTVINSVQEVNAPTLQAAYDIAVTGSGVVHLKAAEIIPADTGPDSEFIAGTDTDVVIAGGYDDSNQTRSGVTVVTGAMKIRAGKVIAEGIALRNPTTGQGS